MDSVSVPAFPVWGNWEQNRNTNAVRARERIKLTARNGRKRVMTAKQNQTPVTTSGDTENLFEQVDWFVLEPRKKRWLVDGLLLRKGSSLLVGKPKAGKSTVAKNIAVAVLKGRSIFGRTVDTAGGQPGRVIYLQMEGKDDVAATAEQFRALGVTAEESKRLRIYQRSVQKGKLEDRVIELAKLLREFPADLVVVDTLRLFTGKAVKDTNSYDDTVEAMDNVEPVLRKSGWQGHLSAVHHGRKDDEKKNQMLDSVLGSSGLAASVNTVILISHPDDDSPLRLISSKQNETDKVFGDLPKTEVLMDEDTYALSLGRTYKGIVEEQTKKQKLNLAVRIQQYLADHPGCTQAELMESLAVRKKNMVDELALLVQHTIVIRNGEGTKKSPFTYTLASDGEKAA
jgi:AAA domain